MAKASLFKVQNVDIGTVFSPLVATVAFLRVPKNVFKGSVIGRRTFSMDTLQGRFYAAFGVN